MIEEIWKPVYSYDDYFVSNIGRVKSYHRYKEGRILKPGKSGNGYLTVALTKNKISVSHCIQILVLEAFICPRPDGMTCLHGDANRINNNLSNLRWGTYSDNAHDQIKAGTFNFNKGEGHQLAKLKNNQVLSIKLLLKDGKFTQREIANQFGINQRQVSKINLGQRWSHITL